MGEERYVPSKEAEVILNGYRLLDDNFMTMFFDQNYEATGLVLNIILKRIDIKVKSITVQKIEKNASVLGRDVIMDILAVDSTGKNYDIEVQRADKGAGRRRARFLSGVLDSRMLNKSEDFDLMCDSYVLFITENDVLGGGLPMYHINRHIEEFDYEQFNDGNHIIYVNGAYKDDSSEIGKLMHDFRCTNSIDMYYDVLKEGMHHFKETEGGRSTVCKAIEVYGEQREKQKAIEMALKMLDKGKFDYNEIAEYTGLSPDEVAELDKKRTA